MRRLYLLAILGLSVGNHASAQIASGTLVVIYRDKSETVIAADSLTRRTNPRGIVRTDFECKITTLGEHIVFANSGLTGYQPTVGLKGGPDSIPDWSAINEAHSAYDESPRSDVKELATSWARRVIDDLSKWELFRHDDLEQMIRENGRGITNGLFADNRAGELTVNIVQISYRPENIANPWFATMFTISPKDCPDPLGPYCAMGESEIFAEFARINSARAQSDAAQWRSKKAAKKRKKTGIDEHALLAIHLVEVAILYGTKKDVGGNIDAAMLRNTGTVQWIQRPDCGAQ